MRHELQRTTWTPGRAVTQEPWDRLPAYRALQYSLCSDAVTAWLMMDAGEVVGVALKRCPFLSRVCQEQGESYARQIATQPEIRASHGQSQHEQGWAPVFEERLDDFTSALRFFHCPDTGVVPLKRLAAASTEFGNAPGCPYHAAKPAVGDVHKPALAMQPPRTPAPVVTGRVSSRTLHKPSTAGVASISMAFGALPDPVDLFRKLLHQKRPPKRGPKQKRSASGNASHLQPAAASAASMPQAGLCPLRKFIPLGGLMALTKQAKCPQPIIQMRAAVARLKPVQELRPQALPVKLVAIGMTAALANVPFGAWREHFEKFSLGWFVAIHATIPFIAVLRKAVIMPRWAIALTISGAVAGQLVGSRIERARLAAVAASAPPTGASSGLLQKPPMLQAVTLAGFSSPELMGRFSFGSADSQHDTVLLPSLTGLGSRSDASGGCRWQAQRRAHLNGVTGGLARLDYCRPAGRAEAC